MTETWLRVGEVAHRTGLTVRTLHHYDQIGLLVPSGGSASGYRLYSPDDLQRLLAITHLKGLGLSLGEIADALDSPDYDASVVLDEHIAAVRDRIASERELLGRLTSLRRASETGWDEVLDVIALSERLRHPDPTVRVSAALGSPDALPVSELIGRLIDEPSDGVRETLTWAIARHGHEATAALLPHLRARSADTRRQVAHVLSKIGDPVAVPGLVALLDDPDPSVAAKAAFALGQIDAAASVEALLAALGRGPVGVRTEVVDALARHRPAVEVVIARLSDDHPPTRADAADVLAALADPTAIGPLGTALTDPDADVRLAAVMALGSLRPAADDALDAASSSEDQRVASVARRLIA